MFFSCKTTEGIFFLRLILQLLPQKKERTAFLKIKEDHENCFGFRELTFRRGDIIFVRRQIDKNWCEGEHNATVGLFPVNYVEVIPYDGIRTTPKKPSEGQARAKFNFIAQTQLELSLIKGETFIFLFGTKQNNSNPFLDAGLVYASTTQLL